MNESRSRSSRSTPRIEGYRAAPFPGESRPSRLKQAVIYKKTNRLEPYTKVGELWNVPPSTIQRHVTKKMKSRGGQPVFSEEQEDIFAKHLLQCADALWPVSTNQMKDYVQRFCQHYRVSVARFRNGRPGKDWLAGFLRRHPELKVRRAAAISAAKAWGTSADKLREFFGRLKPLLSADEADYCRPECVLNYDETAITDDAGDPRVITRRTSKSPRAVLNNNKTSRSVMFAITGDGKCLSPYVCTKTRFKEDDIAEFGPPDCFWNTSKTGWFTMSVFDSWFEAVVAPWAISNRDKKKVIIGDNLSSHLSPVSLQRASELGVSFRLLPPNTTHFLQPLDYAVFGALKRSWRDQLLAYKQSHLNKSILKKHFAGELRKLVSTIKPDTIINGFRATGFVPFDPEEAVARMPPRRQPPLDESGSVLAESLRLNREQRVLPAQNQRRNQLPPGSELAAPIPTSVPESSTRAVASASTAKKKGGRPKKPIAADPSDVIETPSEPIAKKKRGRPRKVAAVNQPPSESVPKKKRGRPKRTV